ncbi:MAG: glycosyltransferase [Dehalococcoidales bacterium]|nr:glycosyltransferase [Dehalococcoidales bacterium]
MITNNKNKVLIISYFFPPENKIASLRIGKFAKYLPQFGWDPIILTAKKPIEFPASIPVETDNERIYSTSYHSIDSFLTKKLVTREMNDVPVSIKRKQNTNLNWKNIALNFIRLARPIYTNSLVSELTGPMGWYKSGITEGFELIKKYNIDVIFSTYSPAVCHVIASKLHSHTKIPWVADFRDLWSLNHNTKKIEPFHFIEKTWEKRTMSNSSILVTVSEPLGQKLEKLHAKKTSIITNGFDEDDYKDGVQVLPKFTITYTGRVYPGKQDPTPLFHAIAELRDKNILNENDLEVRFYGDNVIDIISPIAEKYNIKSFLRICGPIPFNESIRKQKESTVLLQLSWNDQKEKGLYSAKIFEYLGASRPILSIGMKVDVIEELLKNTGAGTSLCAVEDIEHTLLEWLKEFKHDGKITFNYKPDRKAIEGYTRKEQTRKLAGIFNTIIQ